MLDSRINPALAFKLRYDTIRKLSFMELQQVAEGFIVSARASLPADPCPHLEAAQA